MVYSDPIVKPKAPQNPPSAVEGVTDLVVLDPDHPGFRDADYRRRRNEIAQLALNYKEPAPVPHVEYTDAEQKVWRMVWEGLDPLHEKFACKEYKEARRVLEIDQKRVPQLAEINAQLKRLGPFRMLPVAGLVSSRTFQGQLSRGVFLSTQYMRHSSVPFYTPEPDIVHELVGHAATHGHPEFIRLNQAFGQAALLVDDERLKGLERLYWYTLEFGAVEEQGKLKAYGAGLLSSFGELGRFASEGNIQPFDIERIQLTPYDPTQYQNTYFVAKSFDEMEEKLLAYLRGLVQEHAPRS